MSASDERVEPPLDRPSGAVPTGDGPLALIELLDRDGGVTHRIPVRRWPVHIGRAIDCDVILDDPHVAAHHARLECLGNEVVPRLRVGPSRNGARLRGTHLSSGTSASLPSGSEWQLGRSHLRLRLPGESLAAELPLHPPTSAARARRIGLGVLGLLAWQGGEHWLQSDPGDPLAGYLPALLGLPVALGVWSFLWAIGSKLFARHFDFAAHLQLALGVLLTLLLSDALLPLTAFALSWESLARAAMPLTLALGCGLVYGHLGLVLPQRRRALALGCTVMFLVGTGLQMGLNHQRNHRWFAPLYLSHLGPPGLRLAPAVSPQQFLDEARGLREPLDAQARMQADDTDSGLEDEVDE